MPPAPHSPSELRGTLTHSFGACKPPRCGASEDVRMLRVVRCKTLANPKSPAHSTTSHSTLSCRADIHFTREDSCLRFPRLDVDEPGAKLRAPVSWVRPRGPSSAVLRPSIGGAPNSGKYFGCGPPYVAMRSGRTLPSAAAKRCRLLVRRRPSRALDGTERRHPAEGPGRRCPRRGPTASHEPCVARALTRSEASSQAVCPAPVSLSSGWDRSRSDR